GSTHAPQHTGHESLTAGSTGRRKTLASNPAVVLRQIRDEKIQMVDVRFIDLPGVWQHFTLPATELEESSFEDGLGFDGSSIRGFQQIQESDMLLMPDATTAFIDQLPAAPTLNLIR